MNKSILVGLAVLILPVVSQAREYGTAGCGLGNLLFHKESQVFAATTNGSSGNQTFGISSGTSNCTSDGTVREEAKVQLFIEANKLALAKDISRGEGEAISTLSKLLSCNGQDLGPVLKPNFERIFPNEQTEATQVSESIRTILRQNSAQCSYLG